MAKQPAKPKLSLVHGFALAEDVEGLARAKLESSGITLTQARQLGMSWHDALDTKTNFPAAWALPSLRIPYYRADGSGLLMSALPGWPAFFRVRALREPDPKPDDFHKYMQPKGTGVCAYFPRTVAWEEIAHDPRATIIITEGELKAAKATLEGYPTIGLGGVNSYKSNPMGYTLLPALEAIEWPRREVVIIYDSDLQSNSNVCYALNDLAEELCRRGAIPKMVLLPSVDPGVKVGLDDYLVANHPDMLRELIRVEGVHVSLARTLWDLNDKYAYVSSMDRVVTKGFTFLTSPQALKNSVTAQFSEQELKEDGKISVTKVPAADKWMSWPMRETVISLTYEPGNGDPLSLIPGPVPGTSLYNTWTGWGVPSIEGDVSLFVRLVDHLFQDAEPGAKEWFMQWCAYPVQNPGTKLFSSVVIHGLEQGTGKSLVGYTLGRVYGQNFTEISQSNLHGDFNEWAVGKQLIMGDDVTGSDKRQDLDMLKKMITQREIRINAKNQPTYTLADCINYLWTSNQPDAFFLEDKDRRFFIHEVACAPLSDAFYAAYDKWLNGGPGASHVRYYLEHSVDCTGFNPNARALHTHAKDEMTRAARSDLGNWVRDLLRMPEERLKIGGAEMSGDLFTNKQLMAVYEAFAGPDEARRINAKRMASELARAGAKRVHAGAPVSVPGLPTDRYYAIRNAGKWVKATLAELQAHLTSPAAEDRLPKGKVKKVKKY